jgi:hypothetical protein
MNKLTDKVIEQIQSDIAIGDLAALDEFLQTILMYVPEKYLIAYLSEELV